ncbi:MAG TPA: hypothetical protein VF407_08085 [Polyangiaceae bacterium]
MDWQLAIVVAAVVFGLFVFYRFRPLLGGRAGGPVGVELKEARARLAKAANDTEKTEALAACGDACAKQIGLGGAASSYYLRAMRLSPTSEALVERAATGLARRPRTLETLMWRRLGAEPWTSGSADATKAALKQLIAVYTGKRRSALRARMAERALEAMEQWTAKS